MRARAVIGANFGDEGARTEVKRKRKDVSGKVIGRLRITRMLPTPTGKAARVEAECECGVVKAFTYSDIQKGATKSCGCLRREILDKTTHGLSKTKAYAIWKAMHSRCYDPTDPDYYNYGGRGIKIDHYWNQQNPEGLFNFVAWFNVNWQGDGLLLDRCDNNKGYSSGNCRFVTPVVSANNTRPRRKRESKSSYRCELG